MFKIEKTSNTPEVLIDGKNFKMLGVCTPENPLKFFQSFSNEFNELIESKREIELVFHLDYFNTGSSKCLLNLFRKVSQHHDETAQIKITWVYEEGDEEMRESGELYSEIARMDFNFIEQPESN